MRKKAKSSERAIQLSLFDAPAEEKAPAPIAQPPTPKGPSDEEIIQAKEKFLTLGKYHGYPRVNKWVDPRLNALQERTPMTIERGFDAWQQFLNEQAGPWLIPFTKWLGEGLFGDAYFRRLIREGREDMFLHYAWLRHYPERQIGDLLVASGEASWKSAARALDMASLEESIHQLAEEKSIEVSRDQPLAISQEDLFKFSNATLQFKGPHDAIRREALAKHAEGLKYQQFYFKSHGRHDGFTDHCVDSGEQNWNDFLAKAPQFTLYCAYIRAFAPFPLARYLEEAVQRGDMKACDLNDALTWRAGDHNKRRDARWIDPNKK